MTGIDHYIERYHTAVADTVLKVNLYLRQQPSGVRGRGRVFGRLIERVVALTPPRSTPASLCAKPEDVTARKGKE